MGSRTAAGKVRTSPIMPTTASSTVAAL